MLEIFQIEFLLSCLVMAVGIGIDASIATAFQVGQLKTKRLMAFWIVGVTVTHTLFPMLGYVTSYQSLQYFPSLTSAIGIFAFGLIIIFLFQEFVSLLEHDEDTGHIGQQSYLANIGILLAVSWDALWSGPAKSAQVIEWSALAVWLSFLVVGLLIFFMTCMAYRFAASFNISNGRFLQLMKWLQYSVIIYFALLAITRYTFGYEVNFVLLAIVSMSLIAVMLLAIASYKANKDMSESLIEYSLD